MYMFHAWPQRAGALHRHHRQQRLLAVPPGSETSEVFKSWNIGTVLVRIGFWGPLYYNHDKEPPNIV